MNSSLVSVSASHFYAGHNKEGGRGEVDDRDRVRGIVAQDIETQALLQGWSSHVGTDHRRSSILVGPSGGVSCGGDGGELARPSVKDPHIVLTPWRKDHLQRATPRSGHHHHIQPRSPSLSHSQSQGHFRSHSSLSFISRSATIITIARGQQSWRSGAERGSGVGRASIVIDE